MIVIPEKDSPGGYISKHGIAYRKSLETIVISRSCLMNFHGILSEVDLLGSKFQSWTKRIRYSMLSGKPNRNLTY
jgi:hypothetical protein